MVNLEGAVNTRRSFYLENMIRYKTTQAFTLVEMLMVLVIISILSVLAMPVYSTLKSHAQNVVCLGNLRGLHNSLNVYLQDHEMVWPQIPDAIEEEHMISKWWLDTLKPYGMTQHYLTCPADLMQQDKFKHPEGFEASYTITSFDELPNTAFKWRQPWALEKWQNHGGDKGPNLLFPDGHIERGVALFGR